jgi:hypothetical protein
LKTGHSYANWHNEKLGDFQTQKGRYRGHPEERAYFYYELISLESLSQERQTGQGDSRNGLETIHLQ